MMTNVSTAMTQLACAIADELAVQLENQITQRLQERYHQLELGFAVDELPAATSLAIAMPTTLPIAAAALCTPLAPAKSTLPAIPLMVDPHVLRGPSLSSVRHVCGIAFGEDSSWLRKSKRDAASSWARHVTMYCARMLTTASLPQIARSFGYSDHTTVMYGIKRVEERMALDPITAESVKALLEACKIHTDLKNTPATYSVRPAA